MLASRDEAVHESYFRDQRNNPASVQAIALRVSVGLRRLVAIASDRNRQRKHVERARVILASAERGPVQQIAAQIGTSRPTVWRWQQRFAEEGVDGLLRDKLRKPRATAGPTIAVRLGVGTGS